MPWLKINSIGLYKSFNLSFDLSAASGSQLYVAFKYKSTSSAASTFELDNVLVK